MTIINPFEGYRVSQGWSAGHPAIDFATPIGVEFVAASDGVYRRRPSELAYVEGFAGHYGDIERADGSLIRFAHLDRHIARDGARVFVGETRIAATGNTGYVRPRPTPAIPHNGAHMHTTGFHRNKARWNWLNDVTRIVEPPRPTAPAEVEIAHLIAQGDNMFIAKIKNNKGDWDWFLIVPQGNAKPRAIVLGADGYGANTKDAPLPILQFSWAPSIAQLRESVQNL